MRHLIWVVMVGAIALGARTAQADFLGLSDDKFIIYPSLLVKNDQTVTVDTIGLFTDLDCEYCREQHKVIPELNQKGIEVRILAHPRSADTAVKSAWLGIFCHETPHLKLNRWMEGTEHLDRLSESSQNAGCKTPVVEHLVLAERYRIRGTPSLIFKTEQVHSGYLAASEILAIIGKLNGPVK